MPNTFSRTTQKKIKLLRFSDLRGIKGITYSRSQLARLEKAGTFPKRIKLGENCVAWVEAEIDDYIYSRMAARS